MKAQSKNRDPFSRIPIPKSFYHPSQQKKLTKTQKKIALSPGRERCVSPEDEMFLKGSNVFSKSTPPTRENDFGPTKFDESWPSSERPSIASISGHQDKSESVEMLSDVKQSLFTKEIDDKQYSASVLQRYVNRFRNSAPMSREERLKKGEGKEQDFWWLANGSPPTPASSSTPKDSDDGGKQRSRQFIERSESKAYKDTFKSLSNAKKIRSQLEDDLETKKLQEKADRILGRSESSLGSYDPGPAISSDGLTSSESQSSSFEEPTLRSTYRSEYTDRDLLSRGKPYSQNVPSYSQDKPSYNSQHKPSYAHEDKQSYGKDKPVYRNDIKRPEDDILYQWRLQRKMDLSRHGAAELISKNKSEVQSKIKEIQQNVLFKAESRQQPTSSTPQFTPSPYTQVPTNSTLYDLQQTSDEPSTSCYKPVIASPTLSRKQQPDPDHLEPHLHLMCDLLPCPHSKKYQKQYKELYKSSEEDDSLIQPDLNQQPSEQKQFLKAEKPHSDNKSAKLKKSAPQTQTKSSVKFSDSQIQSKQTVSAKQSTESLGEQNVKDSSEPQHRSKKSHYIKQSKESLNENDRFDSPEPRRRSKQTLSVKESRESLGVSEILDSPKPMRRSKQAPSAKDSVESLDESEILDFPEHQHWSKQSVKTKHSMESLVESDENEQSEHDEVDRDETLKSDRMSVPKNIPKSPKKSKVIHPKYSSSPARTTPPIKSAIGETVKDYIFTTSSSIESVSSLFPESPDRSSMYRDSIDTTDRSSTNRDRTDRSSTNRDRTDRSSTNRDRTDRSSTNRDSRERTERPTTSQYQDRTDRSSTNRDSRDRTEQPTTSQYQDRTDRQDEDSISNADSQTDLHLSQSVEENEYISDGEFSDDQLLMLLRQQRNLIERKLGEIDKRLDER